MNCLKRTISNNRGLSLIEIMVALSILAVVGAIAVPQFANYRKAAGYSSLEQSTTNTKRAYDLCRATKSFGECNTLALINMPGLDGSATESVNSTISWCTDAEIDISGDNVKACIQFNSGGGVEETTNKRYCFKDGTSGSNCGSQPGQTAPVVGTYQSQCDTIAFNKGPCGDVDDPDGFCSGAGQTKCMSSGDSKAGVCTSGACT